MVRSGCRAILGRTVRVPEPDCEDRHLDASDAILQAIQDIVVGESVAGLDHVVVEQDAKDSLEAVSLAKALRTEQEHTYTLDKAKEDDKLEAHKFCETPADLQAVLHVSIKFQDGQHTRADTDRLDDRVPDMSIFGVKRLDTINSGGLSRFEDHKGKQLSQRILEHKDPGYARPVKVELVAFFSRLDSLECIVVERPTWSGELNVQQEERTQTECLVKVAKRIEIGCGVVAQDLEEGYDCEDERSEYQADDLPLFFGTSVSTKVVENEGHGDEEGDCSASASYV